MDEISNYQKFKTNKAPEIHPLAVVDSKAQLAEGVTIGSGAVIGPEVIVGANTIVGPNVIIDGLVTIGSENKIFPGACIGLEPQDLKYKGADTEVIIGNGNTIRECVTINRATNQGEKTIIGDRSLLMAYTHIAHGCYVGNGVIIANSVQVAGEVVIEDKAVIGGSSGIHQFVHIGSMAMIGGMSRVDRDVPPYCLVEGHPGRMRGLNRIGIKRSGLESENPAEFRELLEIWNLLYRSEFVLKKALKLANESQLMPAAKNLCFFLEKSLEKGRRGPMPILTSN